MPGVYLISASEGYAKVGIAKDSGRRLSAIQTGCPFVVTLKVFCETYESAVDAERLWHTRLSQYHTSGEWFVLPLRVIERVAEMIGHGRLPKIRARHRRISTRRFAPDLADGPIVITFQHEASKFGMPVFLDAEGVVIDFSDGVKIVRRQLGYSTTELASLCGVSRRTVEGWEQGRPLTAAALNVMQSLLGQEYGT